MERVGTARLSVVSSPIFGEPPCYDGPALRCQVFLSSKTVFSSRAALISYIQCGDARSSHSQRSRRGWLESRCLASPEVSSHAVESECLATARTRGLASRALYLLPGFSP